MAQNLNKLLLSSGVRSRDVRQSNRVLERTSKRDNLKEILSSLWIHVVKPVINAIGYQAHPIELPRVWWCPTGPLAFLPLHAAGLYDAQVVGENISDYVVSSYAPTLSAILNRSRSKINEDFQILTVAQPNTPYAKPLPGTEKEVKKLADLASGLRIESLVRDQATVDRVLQSMKKSNWIHLACHGQQDFSDPMRSGFLLHDGLLQLSKLTENPLTNADFAFLSACQTATGDAKVAEESAHLAAGMLFSGCQGVIATMWWINDEEAPKVAEEVYKHILKDGKPNRMEAAYALHMAVQHLRTSGADFLSWVPFIHLGR